MMRDWIAPKVVADYFNVSAAHIRDLCNEGVLTFILVGREYRLPGIEQAEREFEEHTQAVLAARRAVAPKRQKVTRIAPRKADWVEPDWDALAS